MNENVRTERSSLTKNTMLRVKLLTPQEREREAEREKLQNSAIIWSVERRRKCSCSSLQQLLNAHCEYEIRHRSCNISKLCCCNNFSREKQRERERNFMSGLNANSSPQNRMRHLNVWLGHTGTGQSPVSHDSFQTLHLKISHYRHLDWVTITPVRGNLLNIFTERPKKLSRNILRIKHPNQISCSCSGWVCVKILSVGFNPDLKNLKQIFLSLSPSQE